MAAWSNPFNLSPVIPGINEDKLFGRGGEASFFDPNAKPGDFMGLNPRSQNFAQQAFAAITRQQWNDYLTQYVPLENRLIEYAMDEEAPAQAAELAGRGIGQSFDRQRESTGRRLAGMGLTLTPEEQAAADKQSRLSESLATVGAMNNASQVTRDRQQSVIGNPTPQLPKGGFQ